MTRKLVVSWSSSKLAGELSKNQGSVICCNFIPLSFVNYHSCHNHQKTTTDDLARANVWHFYLYTLCSVALSFLLCLSHITPHLLQIIILPSHSLCFSLRPWISKCRKTCKLQDFIPWTHFFFFSFFWGGGSSPQVCQDLVDKKVCILSTRISAACYLWKVP